MFDKAYQVLHLPLDDGTVVVGRWGDGARTVVAVHGVTASHAEFHALADVLGDDTTLYAPDLRGRGGSRDLGGPYGMEAHADDVAALIHHLGVGPVVVLGHSMGGFVAAVLAARHPDLVSHVVLVDGGLPLDLGALQDLSIDDLVTAIIGPAMERLAMTFPTTEAYLDFWRPHPALADDWSPYVERYLVDDLIPEGDDLKPSCLASAVIEDTESDLRDDVVPRSLRSITQPVLHLRAPRGLTNEAPLYTEQAVLDHRALVAQLDVADIDDVNHYTILLGAVGARQVATAVEQFLRAHDPARDRASNAR